MSKELCSLGGPMYKFTSLVIIIAFSTMTFLCTLQAAAPAPRTNRTNDLTANTNPQQTRIVDDRMRQAGGRPIRGRDRAWLFKNASGYQTARSELQLGTISECRCTTFGVNEPNNNPYKPNAGEYTLRVIDQGATITIRRNNRNGATISGRSKCEVTFQIPPRSRNGLADPACPLLRPEELNRAVFRQDKLTEALRGPTGGLFAISAHQLGNTIRVTVEPNSDDCLTAYDECNRRNLWGQEFTYDLLVHVGAIFHAHNPVTRRVNGGWEVQNTAEFIIPMLTVKFPCRVICRDSHAVANPAIDRNQNLRHH